MWVKTGLGQDSFTKGVIKASTAKFMFHRELNTFYVLEVYVTTADTTFLIQNLRRLAVVS